MGRGIILMVPVTSIQKWDTGFSGGILNCESWYPSWILRNPGIPKFRLPSPLSRYDSSSWGWSDKKKREEMSEDNAW
jgi:hypothetical protein